LRELCSPIKNCIAGVSMMSRRVSSSEFPVICLMMSVPSAMRNGIAAAPLSSQNCFAYSGSYFSHGSIFAIFTHLFSGSSFPNGVMNSARLICRSILYIVTLLVQSFWGVLILFLALSLTLFPLFLAVFIAFLSCFVLFGTP
jgi:hypothetical protein